MNLGRASMVCSCGLMAGTKPRTMMSTTIGVHAIHSVGCTSTMFGSFANSSLGVPNAVRW